MAVPLGCDDSGGFDCGAWHRAERSFDSASSTAELGTTPSGLQPGSIQTAATTAASCLAELSTTPNGLRPGSTSSCSSATRHVALMLVPLDGCDDSGVFDRGARHHAEWTSTAAAPNAGPRQPGTWHSCWCLQIAPTTAASSLEKLRSRRGSRRDSTIWLIILLASTASFGRQPIWALGI